MKNDYIEKNLYYFFMKRKILIKKIFEKIEMIFWLKKKNFCGGQRGI